MEEESLTVPRHRPAEEALGNWRHQAPLPRPLGVAPNRHHHPCRELLSAYTIADTEGFVAAEGRSDRERIMEPLTTDRLDARDTSGRIRWQCLRGLH